MPKPQETELIHSMASQLIDQIIGIRQRRRLIEQKWLASRRAWMNQQIDHHYRGTDTSPSNYNIPAGRRALERGVVRGVKLLTPNVKWFELSPMNESSSAKASNVDKFMWYILRRRIKSRSIISQLMRCMMMYGLCHIKTSITVQNGNVWPSQRAVDPFAFYTFPETAATPDEADLIFEDFLLGYSKYTSMAARGVMGLQPIDAADLTKPEWPYHLTERLAYQGITDTTQDIHIQIEKVSDNLQRAGSSFVSLTELWLPKDDSLYQVYIAWNLKDGPRVVSFTKSEYDQPLYRSVIHRGLPGELYTNSAMEDVAELDIMQNDLINQFHDAVDWEQGFAAINESGMKRTDTLKMKGRALWKMPDDPRQLLAFMSPPNTSNNLLRAWQVDLGLINSLGGNGTVAEGQPGRNMPRSGSAVGSLINLAMADIQDPSELIEQEVLTPSLSDIYKVSSQFIPDHQLMRIPGGQGLFGSILKKADIIGDYEFEWIGSLQFQDEEQNAQRMMIFLNLMPTLLPMLQQQGYTFNAPDLIKMIWRYSLGQRGLDNVIIPMGQQQQQGSPVQAGQATGAVQDTNGQQQPQPVAGLNYSLPSATNGFVKR